MLLKIIIDAVDKRRIRVTRLNLSEEAVVFLREIGCMGRGNY